MLVNKIFNGLTSEEINRISRRSCVSRPTIDSWLKQRRTPRIDLLEKVATAAGFEIMLRKKPKSKVITRDGRLEAYRDNQLIGYAENDILYGMDAKGYAVEIGPINHRVEILGKLAAWRDQ